MAFGKRICLLVALGLVTGFAQPLARAQKVSAKVVKVVFEMSAATGTTQEKGGKAVFIPVFRYDPREGIRAALTKAGFKLVPPESDKYDLLLTITHRERLAGRPAQTTIDHFGLELRDKSGATLLQDGRGPFSPNSDLAAVTQFLIEDLVELVQLRMKSPDVTSCWIEYVAEKGDSASANGIRMASDPNYPDREKQRAVLKPLLRSHDVMTRMFVARLLQALEYSPTEDVEKAVLLIVLSYPFHRWNAEVGEMSPATWAARQGVIPVVKYGSIAIDLFMEDLKGSRCINWGFFYGVEDGCVANRAKAVLMRLSKERWAQFRHNQFIMPNYIALVGRPKGMQPREDEVLRQSDFFRVKYFGNNGAEIGEVEVVNPIRAAEVYANVWNPAWNDHAMTKLIRALEEARPVRTDPIALGKAGVSNGVYVQDIIEILGQIADDRAIQPLRGCLDDPDLAQGAKEAIANIEKRL